ncbi:MAG: transglutaminase domain-containing protein [Verrucomicrobiales bacterium]
MKRAILWTIGLLLIAGGTTGTYLLLNILHPFELNLTAAEDWLKANEREQQRDMHLLEVKLTAAEDRLKAIEREQQRDVYRARAKLFVPDFDDIDLLSIDEATTDALKLVYYPKPFVREPSWPKKIAAEGVPFARYVGNDGSVVEATSTVNAPEIEIAGGLYPSVRLAPASDLDGREAFYYFEFDTVPTFDSPNFWRYPALSPSEHVPDITSRQGLKFWLLRTPHRETDGHQNVVKFPFRVSAMRLPQWNDLDFEELERQARALSYGLNSEDAIREVFNYTRQIYFWASDTKHRHVIDTFLAGLGECGHVNDLSGALLEMNGIRCRGVSGFDPKARALMGRGGGHSAMEVLNPATGQWSYFDPYLDLLAINTQARDLSKTALGQTLVYSLPSVGSDYEVTLAKLFGFRRYWDKRGRALTMSMLQLRGQSDGYGMGWPLNVASEFKLGDLFADEVTIYVRARYGFSKEEMQRSGSINPTSGEIEISPWAEASFTISPRDLLK